VTLKSLRIGWNTFHYVDDYLLRSWFLTISGHTMYTDADRAKALHAESKRLEAFLSDLSPEDWQRPSRCDQWQVADVVAHLFD
jgi:Mycothiol maleylpyruvate isomerase N-terminal domain